MPKKPFEFWEGREREREREKERERETVPTAGYLQHI